MKTEVRPHANSLQGTGAEQLPAVEELSLRWTATLNWLIVEMADESCLLASLLYPYNFLKARQAGTIQHHSPWLCVALKCPILVCSLKGTHRKL